MAPLNTHFYLFMLLLYACFYKSAADRRFSDFKRCADDECSMLLCRGKAAKDFTGPDCRFLSFKKGETIYVYYKLSGQRSDVWAGSVGSHFGYFPKDYLNINHIYTEKEWEVPADETDFVCFDTGLDKFESYNIDVLLGDSLLIENESSTEESKEPAKNEAEVSELSSETEAYISEPPETETTDSESTDKESDSPHPKAENVSSEPTVESEDVVKKETESETVQLAEGTEKADISLSQDEEVIEEEEDDEETEPSEYLDVQDDDDDDFELLHIQSDSEKLSGTEEVTDFKSNGSMQLSSETQTAGSEKDSKEPAKTEQNQKDIPLQTPAKTHENVEEVTEAKNMWSNFEDMFKTEHESEKQEAGSLEKVTEEDMETSPEKSPLDTNVKDFVDSDISYTKIDSEEQIDTEEDSDAEVSELSQLLDTKSASGATRDLKKAQLNSLEIPSEPTIEKQTEQATESEKMSLSLNKDKLQTNKDTEEDLQKADRNKKENAEKDNTQKTITNQKENANETAEEDDLKTGTNENEVASKNGEIDHQQRVITNQKESETVKDIPLQAVKNKDEIVGKRVEKDDPHKPDMNKNNKANEDLEDLKKSDTNQNKNANTKAEKDDIEKTIKNQNINENQTVKEDPHETVTNENEKANEKIEKNDTQKTITDHNENVNETIKEDDLQKAVTNKIEKANENIEKDEPQKTVTIKNEELLESEDKELENPKTTPLLPKTDDQINKVKNELMDLLKNTLDSEEEGPFQEEEEPEDDEELLDDENALLSSSKAQITEDEHEPEVTKEPKIQTELDASDVSEQTDNSTEPDDAPSSPLENMTEEEETENHDEDEDESDHTQEVPPRVEPPHSDSVLRLTLVRDYLRDEEVERAQKYLGLKNLFKIESMFFDLDQELKSARESQMDTEDVENMLDQIMESSVSSILVEIDEMLNEREQNAQEHGHQKEAGMNDVILDAFQEMVFSLRQKYSSASDSTPLAEAEPAASETEEQNDSEEEVKDLASDTETAEPTESLEIHEEKNDSELILNSKLNVNSQDLSHSPDAGLEEDGGHFNKNKDAQIAFEDTEEIQKGPHAILENPVDIGFHFKMDQSSGSMESPSVPDFHDTEPDTNVSSVSTSSELWGLLLLVKEYLGVYAEILITALPEEWRPGPTFHGLPWEPVLVTAAVGILTVVVFFWRSVLAIKSRSYQLTEKQLTDKIQSLVKEKSDAVSKITEMNDMIKEREEQLKSSEKSLSSTQQDMEQLKTRHQKLQNQWKEMSGSVSQLNQNIVETQEENSNLNNKIIKMQQMIEKYQKTLKNYDEERGKVQVLMDEAKLREDAFKAQVLSFEKDNNALKEQKKSLLRDAKDWQEKHVKLSEEIRVYHKTQKELEDTLVHKENEIDVLSSCIAELNRLGACDVAELQKDDAKIANGDDAEKKIDTMRQRIKQMMDVSRITATLSIVEEERNRYMETLLTEQKNRQELEEQYQKVMHDQMSLKNEKSHLENQFKNLQQRLEITTELYQQKENALQQKLTQEELERREKESKLTEVDSKALRSDEEVRSLKQKIKDIEEEMLQNERTLKAEVAIQEQKAHENWLKARTSERALVEERRESLTLRQKLAECSDKISDLEKSLFKLNSGPPDRHMPPMRRGDSYGPSPVSGGAPSPPLMIEGPGRPPSAPVGRRNESFGPRPPSDAHGRFSDLGHPLPSRPEMFPPLTSSPCAHDGPMTAPVSEKAEASEEVSSDPVEPLSKSQSQGSFLPSPIRDSPVPPPMKPYGPPMMGGPVPPNGPPLLIRPHNGHPSMMPPGPPIGSEPRFRPPPMDSYGPPPPMGPYGPVPPFGRGPALRDIPPMGPLPPPPFGPRDVPPDFYGPRGLPPRPFPPGPLPPPGAMIPPPYVGRGFPGPAPPGAQNSRDGEENNRPANTPPTDGSHQPGPAQNTGNSAMTEP